MPAPWPPAGRSSPALGRGRGHRRAGQRHRVGRRAGHEAVRGLAYEEFARSRWRWISVTPTWATSTLPLADRPRRRPVAVERPGRLPGGVREGRRHRASRRAADLVGDVALAVEPIGDLAWDLNVRRWCDDALSAAPESETAYRARLLARATETSIYLGEHAAADQASRTALALAGRSADGTAVIAALGARQLACSAPENLAERDTIAARMVEMGVALRRATVELRGRLWVIDTLWERGDLAGIAATLGRLEWCARQAAAPSLCGICCAPRRRWPRHAASSPLPWSRAGPRSAPSAPSATRQRWAPR